MRVWPGRPDPLGATWDGEGVNFALFSRHATKVELCLFDSADATRESARIELPVRTGPVWHCYLPDCRVGQLYGYRVTGLYDPFNGHRFNHHKVLLDPYARAIGREVKVWDPSLYGYTLGSSDVTLDPRDSAAFAPLGSVISDSFYWGDDQPPRVPWNQTLIYECHVRGMTMRHPKVPEAKRGTYAALCAPPVIRHLLNLGVTTVELLPVHHFVQDAFLLNRKLTNYWGYSSLNFFAPEPRYSSASAPQEAVREFKRMVKTLHRHGIEVILDVVYNHTGEGSELGPTLSYRGIDNACYYRLSDRRYYMNYTGCGNSWNVHDAYALQLVLDSMRYWVEQMHVDGFRFDLCSVLGREPADFSPGAAFFDAVHQDPVLSKVKLIAEPWDAMGSFDVGRYPHPWREWNGKYRDTMREFWRGDHGRLREFATRICGSSDLYQHDGRGPLASINFVTSHDGFPLADLVSYSHKHNEANLENSGDDHNRAWNCGVEGVTDDVEINRLRRRQRRNLLATLLFSQGVPMILGGDELGRTQGGNNNAYCQDNEISWLNWDLDIEQRDFFKFSRRLIELWKKHPVFRRFSFFKHPDAQDLDNPDVHWLTPASEPMQIADWEKDYAQCVGMLLDGRMQGEMDAQGEPVIGQTVLLLINASNHDIPFMLPNPIPGSHWDAELDTAFPTRRTKPYEPGSLYRLKSRSLVLLSVQTGLWSKIKRKVSVSVRTTEE